MNANTIILKFDSFEKKSDHIEYIIIIEDANNDTWKLSARYSTLREIYRALMSKLGREKVPDFPPKKAFGNTKDSFIAQRQKRLENCFNTFLKNLHYDELGPLKAFIESGRKSTKEYKEETFRTDF